jgi:hypothetical protein
MTELFWFILLGTELSALIIMTILLNYEKLFPKEELKAGEREENHY